MARMLLACICFLAGCAAPDNRILPDAPPLQISPDAETFASWTSSLKGELADEVAALYFGAAPISSEITETKKIVVREGREYTVQETFYKGEPYEVTVSGGVYHPCNPLDKDIPIDVSDIDYIRYGGGASLNGQEQGIYIREPEHIQELLDLIASHSYGSDVDMAVRECDTSDGLFCPLVGIGSAGGHGCSQGLYIYYSGTKKVDYISGHASVGSWSWRHSSSGGESRSVSFHNEIVFPFLQALARRTGQCPAID